MVRGHLGVLISQMGKKGIEKAKSSFLSQSSMRTTGFQTFSIPCLLYFLAFLSSTHYSISIAISLSHSLSLSLSPSVPVGLKWLKVTLIWLAFRGSENGRENETTRVQQCTVNTFAPIKLVKTKKKPFGNVTGLIGAPGVHWQKLIPRHSSLHPSATH